MRRNALARLIGLPALGLAALVLAGCRGESAPTQPGGAPAQPNVVPNGETPKKPQSNSDVALDHAKKKLEATWVNCQNADGKPVLSTKLVPRKVEPNPFAPQLTPPGADKQYAFYQFANPVKYDCQPVRLTAADNLNGLRERYTVSWTIPAYRTWESRTGKWSEWQTGRGAETNNVKFLVSTVTLDDKGTWSVEERYHITGLVGTFVRPKCDEIPGTQAHSRK